MKNLIVVLFLLVTLGCPSTGSQDLDVWAARAQVLVAAFESAEKITPEIAADLSALIAGGMFSESRALIAKLVEEEILSESDARLTLALLDMLLAG